MNKYNNLKVICNDLNVNITELCKFVGISRQQFYNICNNECAPSVYTAAAISKFLNINIEFIFGILPDNVTYSDDFLEWLIT